MKAYFLILTSFLIPFFSVHDPSASQAISSEKKRAIEVAKTEKKGSPEAFSPERDHVIEEYEREKLVKLKRNIGRRYLVVRTVRPVEFHRTPEDLQRTFTLQEEKEGFLITEVIQNQSETVYFYQVVFDSGQAGYLMADGNYLELKTLEGGILPLTRKASARGKRLNDAKGVIPQAVTLVKNHLIRVDPMTGQRATVESRMAKARAKFFPSLTWRYEVQAIDHKRCRVIQYSEGEEKFSLIRTWIIDLSTFTVHPENKAAQTLYR